MGHSKRICIITPGHLSTNPRLVKEAQALTLSGHSISIVSGSYMPWAVEKDQQIANSSWNIKPVAFGRKVAPLTTHIRQKLFQASAQKLFQLGLKSSLIAGQSYAPSTIDLIRAAVRVEPCDLYIAHYLPGLVAAVQAARIHNSRYAFDAEDFHPGDLPDKPEHQQQKDWIRQIEAVHLPGALYITAASPMIADAYAAAYAIATPITVLNSFPRSNALATPTPRGTVEPGPSLYWFSQTIGPDRGLECAVRAVAAARTRPHLYMRGTPAPGFADYLVTLAREVGADGHIHLLPPEAPDLMERLAAAHDVGLCGETGHTRNRAVALTNKLFTYLLAGVPPVLSDIPAHRAFAVEAGLEGQLYPVDDHAALAELLDGLLGKPYRLATARAEAWRLGQERYNWDRESVTLQNVVLSALDVAFEKRR